MSLVIFDCLKVKQRQTIVINYEDEVGRGLPEGGEMMLGPRMKGGGGEGGGTRQD